MSKRPFSKAEVIEKLQTSLVAEPRVSALWLGGSAATGFEDDLSDTDLVVICESPEVVFRNIEATLTCISQIWTVEDSIWKGFSQKFYILSEGPQTYYLDIGVFQSKDPKDYREFFNIARHGKAVILLDREAILKEASLAPLEVTPSPMNLQQWGARFEITYRTFLKESQRGKYVDSFLFYQRLILMWVQMLRYYWTPQKYDFGLRYIYRDFPKAEAEAIEMYLQVSSLQEMRNHGEALRQRVLGVLKEKGHL